MTEREFQFRELFEKKMADVEKYAETYEYWAEDMKGFEAKVQWRFGQIKGYQIFKGTDYAFKLDEEIEDPDIVFSCGDLEVAEGFLNGEYDNPWRLRKKGFQVLSSNPKVFGDINPENQFRMSLARIPAFRPLFEKFMGTEESTSVMIPINQALGTYQNQVLPLTVLEYFLNKASHIFLMDHCRCRLDKKCKDYDPYTACMALGKGVLRMKYPGRLANKEEALERAKKAINSGLVPTFGRLRADSLAYGAMPDLGDLFTLCYCCPCCCVVGGVKKSPKYLREIFQRLEGLIVEKDETICQNCGKCLEVCIFGGMEKVNDQVKFNLDKCFGCGRCERVCPNGAISLRMEDYTNIDKMIARIEAHVDIT